MMLLIILLTSTTISIAQTPNHALIATEIIAPITRHLSPIIGFVGRVPAKTTPSKSVNLGKRRQAALSFFACLFIFLGYLRITENRLTQPTTNTPLFFTPKKRQVHARKGRFIRKV